MRFVLGSFTRFACFTLGLLCLPASAVAEDAKVREPNSRQAAAGESSLIDSIEKVTLRRNRDGKGTTWFHPRACMLP